MLSSMSPCYQLYIITYKGFKAFCFIGTLNVTSTNVNVKQNNFNVFCYFNDLVIFQHNIELDQLITGILILIF